MKIMEIEKDVLDRITPTAEDNKNIEVLRDELVEKINSSSKKLGLDDIKPIVVGSVAKDTHLKQVDLDIFIMFPPQMPKDELERLGLKIGYEVLPEAIEQYAEHPYLRGKKNGIQIDLVPCYAVKSSSEKMSAVDRTPFHTEFVKKKLREKLKPEVRLFKQFLKGIGAYGAEIKVQGFSGYLAEVLVIEFGSFHDILKDARTWDISGKTIIPKEVKEEFDRAILSKFIEPLIVIDPVDISRNIASPISEEILRLFISAANNYLSSPDLRFFFPDKPKPKSERELKTAIKNQKGMIIAVDIVVDKLLPDVLYSQVRKSLKAANKIFKQYEFSVERSKFYVNENYNGEKPIRILLVFHLNKFQLENRMIHEGPPSSHPNSKLFLEKWEGHKGVISGPYEKSGRWYVDIERDYTDALALIKTQFQNLNHGKQLNEAVSAGSYRILASEELGVEFYSEEITEFILNKMPWEH